MSRSLHRSDQTVGIASFRWGSQVYIRFSLGWICGLVPWGNHFFFPPWFLLCIFVGKQGSSTFVSFWRYKSELSTIEESVSLCLGYFFKAVASVHAICNRGGNLMLFVWHFLRPCGKLLLIVVTLWCSRLGLSRLIFVSLLSLLQRHASDLAVDKDAIVHFSLLQTIIKGVRNTRAGETIVLID